MMMQPRTTRYTVAASLAALLFSSPAAAQRWNDLEDAIEGRELVMRPTTEGRRKLYLDADGGEAFVLHRGDRLFPLREREAVFVVDADPEDDHIEIELQSARLGRGRVDFHGRAPTAEEFERWLDEVFEITTPESDFHRFVGNRQSGRLHIRGRTTCRRRRSESPSTGSPTHSTPATTGAASASCRRRPCPTTRPSARWPCSACSMYGRPITRMSTSSCRPTSPASGRRCSDAWPVPTQGLPVPLPGRRRRRRQRLRSADRLHLRDSRIDRVPRDGAGAGRHPRPRDRSRREPAQLPPVANEPHVSRVAGILGAIAGGTDNAVDDVIAGLTAFTSNNCSWPATEGTASVRRTCLRASI